MYPGHWATLKPKTPAVIDAASGERLTWQQLNEQSNQVAQLLSQLGLGVGDHVSIFMENTLDFFPIAWGVMRSGMYLTCINRYLTPDEAAYIVEDSTSRVIFASAALAQSEALTPLIPGCPSRFAVGGDIAGFEDYAATVSKQPTTPIADERAGDTMLYSSGTTGRPKGIKRPLTGEHVSAGLPGVEVNNPYGLNADTVYLSPAPLYHAAPFGYCTRTLALGGTVVMMRSFDPELSLSHIEQYSVTHSQWVPTMFIRMLKLEDEVRNRYNLSSHQCAIHAAAPCPKEIKQHMMNWWGPILWEYYAGTERNGTTVISPQEWLAHPGSVGRAVQSILRICDENGTELPVGDEGMVYFEQPERSFEYHNAPDKTESATHPIHDNWTSLGDVGYVDAEGYLYLTDRKAYMIISGGVNIYPQEIEDALVLHPAVQDVAVFGVPNADFGEEVKAVVELADGLSPTETTLDDLMAYAKANLAGYKVPRSIDFTDALPRLPTGKLYKRLLKDQYWPAKH
jgi:fatty-acyl-CoA synthase